MIRGRQLRRYLTEKKCLRRMADKRIMTEVCPHPDKAPVRDWYADKGILVFRKMGYAACGCSKRHPNKPHSGGWGCKINGRIRLKERRKTKLQCSTLLREYQ